jgi:hypothetical protein
MVVRSTRAKYKYYSTSMIVPDATTNVLYSEYLYSGGVCIPGSTWYMYWSTRSQPYTIPGCTTVNCTVQ